MVKITNLTCEYCCSPVGVESEKPRLGWRMESDQRNKLQYYWRICVASDADKLYTIPDLWDSGKVEGTRSDNIEYNGTPLTSRMQCWWLVEVWDEKGDKFVSEPSYWEMGLLEQSDWKSSWIGQKNYRQGWAAYFVKSFTTEKTIIKARAYVCGLGYNELYLNGERIGQRCLEPAQTNYTESVFYTIYDIKANIINGNNTVGVWLGDGWYNQNRVWERGTLKYGTPRLIMQIELTYDDGSVEIIGTDNTWKSDYSPITLSNIYAGEVYDARLENKKWSSPDGDFSTWDSVVNVDAPGGKLHCTLIPPISMVRRIKPVKVTRLHGDMDGTFIFDMGENFAGWVRIKVRGPVGTQIVLRYAEMIGDDGFLDYTSTGVIHTGVIQQDMYIKGTDGEEEWQPRFTYHGFRYVEVTGIYCETPDVDFLEGITVHNDVENRGSFRLGGRTTFNGIYDMVKRTILANLHGYPEDCPVRERCGWLGDAHLVAETAIYNFDMTQMYEKYLQDIVESRKVYGNMQMVSPGKRNCGNTTPAWGTAMVKIPWYLYLYYNDLRVLQMYYDEMKDWIEYLKVRSNKYIVSFGLGDWLPPHGHYVNEKRPPVPVTSTAIYYSDAVLMSKIATILDKQEDAAYYDELANNIKVAFNAAFFNNTKNTYGTECANLLALAYGLCIDSETETKVADNVATEIMQNSYGFESGIVGFKHLFEQLTEHGWNCVSQNILERREWPGLGYMLSNNATTLWETFHKPPVNGSLNHPMFGGFAFWYHSHLCGIKPDNAEPGFKKIIIKPYFLGISAKVSGSHISNYGDISVSWEIAGDMVTLNVSIPANTTAVIHIPASEIADDDGCIFSGTSEGRSVLSCGSGSYSIKFKYFEN